MVSYDFGECQKEIMSLEVKNQIRLKPATQLEKLAEQYDFGHSWYKCYTNLTAKTIMLVELVARPFCMYI